MGIPKKMDYPGTWLCSPLYKPYRYVPPHWVWFLHCFGLKTGIHFAHCCQESGIVIKGATQCLNVFTVSIPNE